MDNFIIPGLDPKTSFEISSNKTKKLNSNDTSLNEASFKLVSLLFNFFVLFELISKEVFGSNPGIIKLSILLLLNNYQFSSKSTGFPKCF